jgi:hypothetical protein
MAKVVHFEIPVDDPERAVRFYQAVLGWKIEKWQGPMDYWLATAGAEAEPGINGALTRRQGGFQSTVNTLEVPSVDDLAAKVVAGGGSIVMPKTAIPGIGYLVYCNDTEGNLFGMMQSDPNAQ